MTPLQRALPLRVASKPSYNDIAIWGRGLSNLDLDYKCQDISGYEPATTKDRLPSIGIIPGMKLIINLENHDQGGSHWVSLYCKPEPTSPNGIKIFYNDSFGIAPPQEIVMWAKNYKVVYQTNQLQDVRSRRCGMYAYYFIRNINNGKDPWDIVYSLLQTPSISNERKVQIFYEIK